MLLSECKVGHEGFLKDGKRFQVVSQVDDLTMVQRDNGLWSVRSNQPVFRSAEEAGSKLNQEEPMAKKDEGKGKREGNRASIIKAGLDAKKDKEAIIKDVLKVFPDLKPSKVRMQISAVEHYRRTKGKGGKKAKATKAAPAAAPAAPAAEAPAAPAAPAAEAAPKAKKGKKEKAPKAKKEKKAKKNKASNGAAPEPPAAPQAAAPVTAAPAPAAPAAASDDLF